MVQNWFMNTTQIPSWSEGDRFRKARQSAGLSQGDLATKARISRSTVTNAENDKHQISYHLAAAWADVTGVPVEWLLEGVEPSGSPEHVTAEYQRAA